jgi:KDO2-lipid IV(A) lauroyltransferase
MFTVRGEDNKYLFKILPEIPFSNTGDTERDIMVNTQRHNDAIEDIVRQYPEQWLWLHNRWETTPESLHEYLVNKRKEKEQTQQASDHKQ